jgi:hypothetical protein
MTARDIVVLFFAVIGVANVIFMFAFVAIIWANERAARRRTVRAWDGSNVRVIGGRRWR